jgi:hypothetical protein
MNAKKAGIASTQPHIPILAGCDRDQSTAWQQSLGKDRFEVVAPPRKAALF